MPKVELNVSKENFGEVIHLLEHSEFGSKLEIGIFTCDAGKSLEKHDHGEMSEWCYVLDGNAVFDIEGEKTTVKQGEMILLPSNKKHLSYPEEADKSFTSIYIICKKE